MCRRVPALLVVLRIGCGETSSLLCQAGDALPFGGLHLVIVEAPGYAPAYVVGSRDAWQYEEYDATPDEIQARLDLSRIVLKPSAAAEDQGERVRSRAVDRLG